MSVIVNTYVETIIIIVGDDGGTVMRMEAKNVYDLRAFNVWYYFFEINLDE